jgi:hypothetical protein
MFSRPRLTVWAMVLGSAAGCVYPRHATPLLSVMHSPIDRATQPEDLWRLTVVSADIPAQKRSGLSWDEDNGKPDPYVVLRIQGNERWHSSAVSDSLEPQFDQPPKNLKFARGAKLRFELWDSDGMSSDPIGLYEGRVFSESVLGSDTTIKLDSGANLTVRLDPPEPKQGAGLAEYELRPRAVVVRLVTPNSPAARARLQPGDKIVAIDGKALDKLTAPEVESALSLASQHQSELRIKRGESETKVKLDNGYVWPWM